MGNGRSERFDSAPKRGVVKDRENWHNVRPVSHLARPRPAPLLGSLSALRLAVACRTASPPVTRYDPAHDLGPLFQDVQLAAIFPDSKTFVDARPLLAPAELAGRYTAARGSAGFSLQRFVEQSFEAPRPVGEGFHADTARPMEDHIRALWAVLTRPPDTVDARSSLMPLPQPYVVPGGRFREVYYWDSYFTMLGLVASGRTDLVHSMLDNFAYLIRTVGHIPNGNRTYYLSRSQPPFFGAMIGLYATATDTTQALAYLDALEAEHAFWMDGAERLAPAQVYRRVVRLPDGSVLNRYWDDRAEPRPESYRPDYELAQTLPTAQREAFYRNVRATAQSGWDFSSRWLRDPKDLRPLERLFLKPGGFVPTLISSGQQWDAPNGWAPLEWLAIEGVRRYGRADLADAARDRWLAVNRRTYRATGKMTEKYDVVALRRRAGGGEYPTQDGFGWTNGVALALEGVRTKTPDPTAATAGSPSR